MAATDISDHDEQIAKAYVWGLMAARAGKEGNPFFQDTQLHIAYESGYQDQLTWAAKYPTHN